jgi:exodeoxyribonuclease VII large subunit
LQRERDETLKRLQKEGLLNLNQQLDFPVLPKRIALISADTSKGYSDFMKVIEQNPWGYKFFTMLFPAYLQGDVAVSSIIEQLERIKKVLSHFDIVVIVRGGGGEVGMTCYNNYELCKAIASFPIPVLTGIGHSTNLTVAEMISFRNAITPTELGEFLIQSFHEFSVPVQEARKSIRTNALKLIEFTRNAFSNETKHFRNAAHLYLNRSDQELQNATRMIQGQAKMLLVQNKEIINASMHELKNSGYRLLKDQRTELSRSSEILTNGSQRILERKTKEIENLNGMVRLLNPINVLKRGFSITTMNGQTLKEGMDLKEGTIIETTTFDLKLVSEIKSIGNNERED